MVGFPGTKERVGQIVKQANLAEDKKEKKEKVTPHADPLWRCAIPEKNIKKDQKEFRGKGEIKPNKQLIFFYEF